jgi:hypothetical protein
VPVSRVLSAAIIACSVSLAPASSPALAQGATPPQPTLKKTKDRGAVPESSATTASGGITKQQRLALCIETWDAQTHMSRREWRVACERSVREYPDAFN